MVKECAYSHRPGCTLCLAIDVDKLRGFDVISSHGLIVESGSHNYMGCQIHVFSRLNIPFWKAWLNEFHDQHIVQCLEFGWPLYITKPVVTSRPLLQTNILVPINFTNRWRGIEFWGLDPSAISHFLDNEAI